MVSSMSPTRLRLLAELEISKRRALTDFYYFCNKVLGYDLMVPRVHQPMCTFLARRIERPSNEQATKILLEPRGTFKSTIGSVAYPLWCLVNNPNMTILLNNEKQERVVDFLREIKFHITDNEKFRTLFGNLSTQGKIGKRWNESRIDIDARKVWTASPSIDTASTTSSTVGKHADLIINDDLVGESNVGTKEQLEKVDEFVKNLGAVLNPGGDMYFIGTRWHHLDVYNTQMEHIKSLGKYAWADILIEKAIRDDGSLFFPERLSEQFLKSQRVKMSPYFFNCQYMNQIISRENALIKRIDKYGAMINDMPAEQFFREKCNIFVTVDLAYTDTARSDNTVIFVQAVDAATGHRYVVHYDVFKTTEPTVIIDKLFEVDKTYKPVRFGIEANNYTSWLRVPLRDAMRERNHFLNIDPEDGLKHYGKGQGKAGRLTKLAPVYNYGQCSIAEDMIELEDQLLILTYDGTKGHDDLLDAHAMQEEIIFWGSVDPTNKYDNDEAAMEREHEPKEKTLDDLFPEGYSVIGEEDEADDSDYQWLSA